MASQNDGDDLSAGNTNNAQSGTELVANPSNGHLAGGNPFIFQVKPGLLFDSVDGIRGTANGAGRGVFGTGQTGVSGVGSVVGVTGLGGPDGVRGMGTSNGVVGTGAIGVAGVGTSIGITGTGPGGSFAPIGVQGDGTIGVLGQCVTGSGGVGVRGQADGQSTGVVGQGGVTGVSGTGDKQGVSGQGGDTGVTGTGTIQGVVGRGGQFGVVGSGPSSGVSGDSGSNGFGVIGTANGTSSTGVRGNSDVGVAVEGISPKGTGGAFSTDSGTAIRAVVMPMAPPDPFHPQIPGFAGVFIGGQGVLITGPLVVGSLTVTGGGAKSAAVPHPDGSHRLLYCVESPESWFEDFGEGTLAHGEVRVPLDPDFAALVETGAYHVFLTPYGESRGLYVDGREPSGFVVHEQQGGTSDTPFSYRVVARRKDLKVERHQKFTVPAVHAPFADPPAPAVGAPSGVVG